MGNDVHAGALDRILRQYEGHSPMPALVGGNQAPTEGT
jgi:hypothetical protein